MNVEIFPFRGVALEKKGIKMYPKAVHVERLVTSVDHRKAERGSAALHTQKSVAVCMYGDNPV